MKLYNTMSMQKEEFVPIEPGKVRMYACGPTVYNYIHVGNARPIIMFDVLRRYLEYRGYEVTFVQNFTDVDDKIIQRANEEGISSEEVAKKYIAEYFTDAHALGVREATVHPKATENIQQIIDLIKKIGSTDFDVDALKEQAKGLFDKVEGVLNEISGGDTQGFFESLWNKIVSFFQNLFQ